ncbi:HNH endonuclease [Enterobacter asburiae]|nr:HNH endonuclease [Enterobacter asburiae]
MHMAKKCYVNDCDNRSEKRGMCGKHYFRWRKYGDPLVVRNTVYSSPQEAIKARTKVEGECQVWTGAKLKTGYGSIRTGGKALRVHRFVWESVSGPVPDGMDVDHICRNRLCCNINHLRLASRSENNQNLGGAKKNSKTGVLGVTYLNRGNRRWLAQVKLNGKFVLRKTFMSLEEARDAAIAARLEHFTHNEADRC